MKVNCDKNRTPFCAQHRTRWFNKNLFLIALVMTNFSSNAIAGWEVQWADKFDGTGINWNNWTAQIQANYNNEVQCYTDDESSVDKNFEVSNGTLKIIARKQNISCPGLGGIQKSWTSGRLNSKDKSEFLYGRIESRIRFHNLEGGTWPAFWMLENRIAEHPKKNDNDFIHWPNPGAGEIDVWEWFANAPSTYITNFFNTGGCGSEVRYTYPGGAPDVQQWHNYAIEWDENNIAFYVDDFLVTSHNVSNCQQYKEPMFVLLNVAMGGNLGGNIDPSLNTATLEIDYVAHCSATTSNNLTQCSENTPEAGQEGNDDDGDGVSNEFDLCPNTPTGAIVDSSGCILQNEVNTAPEVNLSISQNGENRSTINPANGTVTITAIINDANQDNSFTLEWDLQNLPSPVADGQTISFDPSSMADGTYVVSVTVADDGDPVLSASNSVSLNIQTTDAAETTNSGGSGGGGGSSDILLLIFASSLIAFRSNIIHFIALLFGKSIMIISPGRGQ